MPELATTSNQLLQELSQLHSMRNIDQFTLKRLQKEAQSLLKSDPLNAHLFLGALAGLKGERSSIHENYKQALTLAPTNPNNAIVLSNYITSLLDIGSFSEAVEPVIKAYDYKLPISEIVTTILAKAGLFHRVAELIRQDHLVVAADSFIFRTERFMDQHGVSDAELQKLIEIAISVLHAHRFFDFRSTRIITEFAEEEDSQWFRYVIKINCSVEEIVDLKYELACQLAEDDLSTELLLNFITAYEFAEEQYGSD